MADSSKPVPRDSLISSVSHDLRAPLAAVQMGASFVLQQLEGRAEHERSRKILAAVLRSCGQMDRLLRNFSDLSHLEAHDVELVLSDQDAKVLVEVVLEGVREAAEARDVHLTVDLPPEPLIVRLDRDRMVRALGHLVENAVRHGPEGSPVTVGARSDGESVVFAVTDQGPGPSAATRDHLFDRTWHATNKGRAGAGLGLAIARGLANLHGGDVALTTKGSPTTFTLRVRRAGPTV